MLKMACLPTIHLHYFTVKQSAHSTIFQNNNTSSLSRYFKPCLWLVVAAVPSSRELSIDGWELTNDRQLLPRQTPLSLLLPPPPPPHQILNKDHINFQRRRRLADPSRGQVTLGTNCRRHPILTSSRPIVFKTTTQSTTSKPWMTMIRPQPSLNKRVSSLCSQIMEASTPSHPWKVNSRACSSTTKAYNLSKR